MLFIIDKEVSRDLKVRKEVMKIFGGKGFKSRKK